MGDYDRGQLFKRDPRLCAIEILAEEQHATLARERSWCETAVDKVGLEGFTPDHIGMIGLPFADKREERKALKSLRKQLWLCKAEEQYKRLQFEWFGTSKHKLSRKFIRQRLEDQKRITTKIVSHILKYGQGEEPQQTTLDADTKEFVMNGQKYLYASGSEKAFDTFQKQQEYAMFKKFGIIIPQGPVKK